MRYVSWTAFYEGPSDALYLDVLLPRLLREIIANDGLQLADVADGPSLRLGRNGRGVDTLAAEICDGRDAYDLVFIHADIGGRGLAQQLATRSVAFCEAAHALCNWPVRRCVTVTPRHETEAWLLADPEAVTGALGFNGPVASVGLPATAAAAERLVDPKDVLTQVIATIAGRRRAQRLDVLFPAIAQRQRFSTLRNAGSFQAFEARLRDCLRDLAVIA